MVVLDIKAFVPSKDYDISKAFYRDLGFSVEYVTDDLALCENGECTFFLQRFYQPELANNFMLQICVDNIEDAFQRCNNSEHKTKISEIQQESWGKVFYVWGPGDELLHMTELNGIR
ncbi:lactoylglutathione lyase [Alteromonas sp. AMM-1]|uniref:lactoylglutathione lyase n=1 Tax=Alteromonas sp. AMM-1 TaxID=3394233 RepID=UPI0039A71E5B